MRASALHDQGYTYSEIAAKLGCSRSAVAGKIYRERHPSEASRVAKGGFRDIEAVRGQVALADAIGLSKAARVLGMDVGHLCRNRQRLKHLEAAQ